MLQKGTGKGAVRKLGPTKGKEEMKKDTRVNSPDGGRKGKKGQTRHPFPEQKRGKKTYPQNFLPRRRIGASPKEKGPKGGKSKKKNKNPLPGESGSLIYGPKAKESAYRGSKS